MFLLQFYLLLGIDLCPFVIFFLSRLNNISNLVKSNLSRNYLSLNFNSL